MSEYLEKTTNLLRRIESEEADALSRASAAVAEVICRDGLVVHVFGCGHSHLAALDAFYRAGGLACVSPLLDEDLMLHDGAAKSSRMEKMPGIAAEAFRRAAVDPAKDILVVISASGKNAAPAEMIFQGMDADAVKVVKAVRDRHDGLKRNPFSEPECGHNYARSMASWNCLLAWLKMHGGNMKDVIWK